MVDLIKRHIRKEAKKLMMLENMYTYLAEKSINSEYEMEDGSDGAGENASGSWIDMCHSKN